MDKVIVLGLKKNLKYFSILIFLVLLFLVVNKHFGWYAYEKHKLRRYSATAKEAKQRGVFVKKVNLLIA